MSSAYGYETANWTRPGEPARRGKMKEISTRRIRPCLPELDVLRVVELCRNWDPKWESEGTIAVHDDGLMQYTLCDSESHHKFYAALILGKTAIRCSLRAEEPADLLAEVTNGGFVVHPESGLTGDDAQAYSELKAILQKRGFRFPS